MIFSDFTDYSTNIETICIITKIFTERRIDVQSVTSRATKQGMATIIYEFEVPDSTTLKNIIEKIRQVESVIDIDRTTG